MKITRRNFIQFVVGGVAGIHMTPLPWKLTDDIAIWTQNWSWVPVPPVGEFTHVKSVCQLCPGGCGIEVRKVGSRAVKIEGRIDYPVNPGGICPLGMGGLQLLYDENIRFTSPMKRVGPRGAGEFSPISWDEALHELTDRIRNMRQQGKPETLAAIDGHPTRSSMALLIQRLLTVAGSPNYVRIPRAEDTYSVVNRIMVGSKGPMGFDVENADFILSFGCGLIEGWGGPGRMINAWGLWRDDPSHKGTKVVQIESRASNTASKADQWIAPRPGTEAALALGVAHVIIREGLYDPEFVHKHTFGFDDWTTKDAIRHRGFKTMVLERYSPESVAQITGVSASDIVSLARGFARAKAPLALCGKGKGDLSGSLYEFMAVHSLNGLVGNINKPGGVLVQDPLPLSPWPKAELDTIAKEGLEKERVDLAGSMKYPFSQSLIHNMAEAILEHTGSPVDTLLIFSSNPAFTLPDGGSIRSALKKIPFIVSFSPYRDESSSMADLILPDHNYLEKMDDIVWPFGLQYPLYGLSKPVVKPLYDTQHAGDVIIKLAKMVGGSVEASFPWEGFEEAIKERAKGLFDSEGGLTRYDESRPLWKDMLAPRPVKKDYKSFDEMWENIKSGGLWYRPVHKFKNWETLFKTSTGKFELFSSRIEEAVKAFARESSMDFALQEMAISAKGDEVFMPHYEAPVSSVDKEKYPLLMIPFELINVSSNWLPSPPYLKKTIFDHQLRKEESFAEINSKTAAKYGLKEGDRVIIQSSKGRVRVRVHLFEGAMPDTLFLPLGFGHWAYDDFLRGQGVNPNQMIEPCRDPLSGQNIWWDTRVRLIKV